MVLVLLLSAHPFLCFMIPFVSMGVSMSAVHRIAAFSATTLGYSANQRRLHAAAGLARSEAKDSYKYVGMCTVVNTTIATAVVTLLLTLFPGLA